MIPKVIHYCWFGGNPLPPLAERCIASWKKYLPDYEIKRWDESNFDVNSIPYTQEAYEERKYAFVSDYARFKILHEHGGIYFDTDVEVIRPMSHIISAGAFMGCETAAVVGAPATDLSVAPGLGIGAEPGLGIIKEILDLYRTLHFRDGDGNINLKTVVEYATEFLVNKGLKNTPEIQEVEGVKIYPVDYFCPINVVNMRMEKTPRTVTIHHFAGSWMSPSRKLTKRIQSLIGPRVTSAIQNLKHIFIK